MPASLYWATTLHTPSPSLTRGKASQFVWVPEEEYHSSEAAYQRCHVAKQSHRVQTMLRDLAQSMAQLPRLTPVECELRVVREEHARWVAVGVGEARGRDVGP